MKSASFFLNCDRFGLDDRGNVIAARSHPGTVDFVSGIDQRDGADQAPAVRRVDVQLFAQRTERDFQIFDHRVAFVLSVERLFRVPSIVCLSR